MLPGDVSNGYLRAQEPYLSLLSTPQFASIFVYRDPRDMIVSHVFYATDIHTGHGMHQYYQNLGSTPERISAAISGVEEPGFELPNVNERYASYIDWLKQPNILSLRFEDLRLQTEQTLNKLLDFLALRGFTPNLPRDKCIQSLRESISPHRSGTFRKGQPGNWREHFSGDNKELFKELAGDLLISLGYEQGHDW
ncbi:MAG: sulfotransferase domain-containing protein [Chloroflexota bacterium]